MLFVCWLWRGRNFWKRTAKYDERHVEKLAAMLRRNGGHELVCVHDGSFAPRSQSVVMPEAVAALPDYLPKLWAWSPEFHAIINRRFASIDLDVVVTGDLAPVLGGSAPLQIWNHAARERYNTSLFVLDRGYGHQVWERLSEAELTKAKRAAAYWTGDQSWVSHVLGDGAKTFGEESGVIQYRPHLHRDAMPLDMLAGFMCGPYEPFTESEKSEWVRVAYR